MLAHSGHFVSDQLGADHVGYHAGASKFLHERPHRRLQHVYPDAHPVVSRTRAERQPRYSWSGGNGFVGVGWSVSGFSRIARKSAEGGWPSWDSTDTFWFQGQVLIACGASASPGCTSGGTHFSEHENYLRITDNGNDTWTVTNRSGGQSTYIAMGRRAPTSAGSRRTHQKTAMLHP